MGSLICFCTETKTSASGSEDPLEPFALEFIAKSSKGVSIGKPSGKALDIFQRGLRLEALLNIWNDIQAGKLDLLKDQKYRSPGEKIRDGLVKPRTKTNQWSYSEQLYHNKDTTQLVGPCTTFLSHPWSANFNDTVFAIQEYEKSLPAGTPKQFYFVDYFAINQHNPEDDLEKLGTLVKKCGTLVLMAKPWNKPVALTRLWCIYELAHALIGKSKVAIILPPKGKQDFQENLVNNLDNVWEFCLGLFKNIDSKNATATMEKDVRDIRTFIRKDLGGFDAVNLVVANGLRMWVQAAVLNIVDKFPAEKQGTEEHAFMLYSVAKFCHSQNMLHDSERFYVQSGTILQKLEQNSTKQYWLNCQHNRILLLPRMGRLTEALELALKNVNDHVRTYGPDSEDILEAEQMLGIVYRKAGKLIESEKLLRRVVEKFKEIQEPMSVDIRGSMTALANTLMDAGKLEEAKSIIQDIIKYQTTDFGRHHPTTMCPLATYGRCIALEGKHREAINLYKEALPVLRTNYGSEDEDVQNIETWLQESQDAQDMKKIE